MLRAAGSQPAMPDVLANLRGGQRRKGQSKRNALLQLAQVFAIQSLIQLALSDQQDLKTFLSGLFEISQHPDFLEDLRAELMRLIHDQGRDLSLALALYNQVLKLP